MKEIEDNKSLKPLYIFGAGGFGREAAWLVERINAVAPTWAFQGFVDDDEDLHGTYMDGYMVCGGYEYLQALTVDTWIVLAIGNAKIRKKETESLASLQHIHYATLVDPGVVLSSSVSIGEGSMICAGNIMTVDIAIGKHNIINLDCTIGHDAQLSDFVTLYPSVNVSGNVKIGTVAELGTGAQIIQGMHIGSNTVIGAGAVVVEDIPDDVTAVGCPAKVINRRSSL